LDIEGEASYGDLNSDLFSLGSFGGFGAAGISSEILTDFFVSVSCENALFFSGDFISGFELDFLDGVYCFAS
jgi:hypothetical protein